MYGPNESEKGELKEKLWHDLLNTKNPNCLIIGTLNGKVGNKEMANELLISV